MFSSNKKIKLVTTKVLFIELDPFNPGIVDQLIIQRLSTLCFRVALALFNLINITMSLQFLSECSEV